MNRSIIVGSGRGLLFADFLTMPQMRSKNRETAAIVEVNPARHADLKQHMANKGMGDIPVFASLTEALAAMPAEEAQSVIVVSPNRTHAALACEVLAANRHLLLEKPVAADWEDARIIRDAVRKTDRVVQLGFVLRYSAFFRKIREFAASGAFGKIVQIQAGERLSFEHSSAYRRDWRRYTRDTGGLMNEKCSHDLDIIRWIKKGQAEPVEVYSIGGSELFPPHPEAPEFCADCGDAKCVFRYDLDSLAASPYRKNSPPALYRKCIYHTDSDVMTNQSAAIRFSDGTQAQFSITLYAGSDEQRDIRVLGTEGHLFGDLKAGRLEFKSYRDRRHEVFECAGGMHGGGDMAILEEFYNCIDNDSRPEASCEDGIEASKMAFAANLSAAEGRPVKLSEFN